jgi:hypothetical protein
MIKQFDLPAGLAAHRVVHDLDTTALIVNAWQNDHSVTPSVRVIDKDTVEVYSMYGGGTLVIAAADPKPTPAKPKTSRSTKTSEQDDGSKRRGPATRGNR